jgi:hypothetical protein
MINEAVRGVTSAVAVGSGLNELGDGQCQGRVINEAVRDVTSAVAVGTGFNEVGDRPGPALVSLPMLAFVVTTSNLIK